MEEKSSSEMQNKKVGFVTEEEKELNKKGYQSSMEEKSSSEMQNKKVGFVTEEEKELNKKSYQSSMEEKSSSEMQNKKVGFVTEEEKELNKKGYQSSMEEKSSSEMQNKKVGFVTEEEEELNKKVGLLTEVDAKSIGANRFEEDGFWSIQKGKSDEQNNHPNLDGVVMKEINKQVLLTTDEGSESINNAETPIEEEEEVAEEQQHGSNQKGSSEKQINNLGGSVLIEEGLNKILLLGTNNGIDDQGGGGGGDQSINQQGGDMIKSPNSLSILKKVPSFPGAKEIIPLLYMPPSQSDKEKKNSSLNSNYHTLLDLSKTQGGFSSRIYLPELETGSRICGFSKRWMAITKDESIQLLNPFTRDVIQLPNRSELPVIPQNGRFHIHYKGPYYITKVAIVDSSSGNMVVGALDASGMVFFTRRTDDHWTLCNNIGFFKDIITWKEKEFLGLKENGDVINLSTTTLFSHVQLPNWPFCYGYSSKCYLAECPDGGLLLVSRLVLEEYNRDQAASSYTTKDFKVIKLQAGEWVRKYELQNNRIFVGLSESRVYEVDHVNRLNSHGSIYFSDDHFYKYYNGRENFITSDSGHFTIKKQHQYVDLFHHQPYSPPSPPLWVGGPA